MTQQELLQTIAQAAAEGWEELDLSDQQLTEEKEHETIYSHRIYQKGIGLRRV